jgi:hypothetical protein
MTWVLGNWIRFIPYVAVAAVLAGVYFYWHHQQAEIANLKQSLTVAEVNGALAEKLARSNAFALDAAEKQHADDEAAIVAHFKRQASADKATAAILESIKNAPDSDDGPVAPMLMRVLDCLRQRAAAPPGAGGSYCEGKGAGGASGLPGESSGSTGH